jgi:hypothetical protein
MNQPRLRYAILRIRQLAFLGCMATATLHATDTPPSIVQKASRQIEWIRRIVSGIAAENPPAAIVQLRNLEEVEGYVIRTGIESFLVMKQDGTERLIAYNEVRVTEYPDPEADPRDSNAEPFTVIGVAPRRASTTVYSRSKCNRLRNQYLDAEDAWESAGFPAEGPESDALDNAIENWRNGRCSLH